MFSKKKERIQKMKDLEIGKIIFHPTMGRLKVVAEGAVNECYGCVFDNPKMCSNEPDKRHTGECSMERRIDKQGVIFVKAEGGVND